MTEDAPRFVPRDMLVKEVRWEADDVISIGLAQTDGGDVPEWTPGSHVDLVLPSGLVRQYSLCSRPQDRKELRVAVLRDPHGRGGSKELHDTQLVGRTIAVRGPRNHFKVYDAEEYILVAGGIGITPILSMARHLDREGAPWRLLYGGRSRKTMAFLQELEAFGSAVTVVPEDEQGLPDLRAFFEQATAGAAIYCCGPEGLIRAVEEVGADLNIPVHLERFAAGPKKAANPARIPAPDREPANPLTVPVENGDGGQASHDPDGPFQIELKRTGITLTVAPDRTVLDTVREHLPETISSCEEGFCGACETSVVDGIPDHRDEVLDPVDRATNETMMICVSRSRTKKLVLDL
jgi:ferredoxin-NADP reductase